MIKKYTALCLITSITLYADDIPKPRIREIIVIDENGTGKISSIIDANSRLQEEIRQKTDATIEKHEQEHKTQQEKMKREHEENIKNHSRSFLVRLKENAALLDQQFAEAKEKSDQQVNIIQEVLNSSATYQLLELNLKNNKAELEKKELHRKYLYGATALSQIAAIIAGYQNSSWSLGGSLTLCNGIIFGYIYDATDGSNTKETIKEQETILIRLRPTPVIENKEMEIEQQQKNNQSAPVNDEIK
jgi:lipopolysaccharide export LptBFGC system permease protein LptF